MRALFLGLQACLACFIIRDVYLIDPEAGPLVKTGLRDDGDEYNPPEAGCNRIPCGLGTNTNPNPNRFLLKLTAGQKVGMHLLITNNSFSGTLGIEFRYGDNPAFPNGTRAFPLWSTNVIKNADQDFSHALTLTPSFTANATVQVYFSVNEITKYPNFYQCFDLQVTGDQPLPAWAPDFGPSEKGKYDKDPTGTNPGCVTGCYPYIPTWRDFLWLIILCILAFFVLLVFIIIIFLLCCRRKAPPPVTAPPPEPVPPPPEPVEQHVEAPKEITPSTEPTPYVRYKFMDPHDPPSKKGADSSGSDKGTGMTGSQGRHFHFHYDDAEEPAKDPKDPH